MHDDAFDPTYAGRPTPDLIVGDPLYRNQQAHQAKCQLDRDHNGPCMTEQEYRIQQAVDHPSHYGGRDDHYEAIKVIDAWGLGFCLGNTVKYIARAGKKDALLQDLKKAQWYLNHEIERLEREGPQPG